MTQDIWGLSRSHNTKPYLQWRVANTANGRSINAVNKTKKSGAARTSNKTTRTSGVKKSVTGNYRVVGNNLKSKINSYQTLWKQTQGPTSVYKPKPTIINTMAKWIDKGACLHTVTKGQIQRWGNQVCKTQSKTYSKNKTYTATSARTVLYSKFGKTPIKAVCTDVKGNFLVVTTPTYKGKTFKFPK